MRSHKTNPKVSKRDQLHDHYFYCRQEGHWMDKPKQSLVDELAIFVKVHLNWQYYRWYLDMVAKDHFQKFDNQSEKDNFHRFKQEYLERGIPTKYAWKPGIIMSQRDIKLVKEALGINDHIVDEYGLSDIKPKIEVDSFNHPRMKLAYDDAYDDDMAILKRAPFRDPLEKKWYIFGDDGTIKTTYNEPKDSMNTYDPGETCVTTIVEQGRHETKTQIAIPAYRPEPAIPCKVLKSEKEILEIVG